MSPRDLPLWARAIAAALMIVASWWLRETDALREAVGESVSLVALAVVSASILRGMHLPLALWPEGPWRERFSRTAVVGVAMAFGAVFVALAPDGASGRSSIDAGMAALVTAGVVGWGFAVGLTRQRRYLRWYAIAAAAALAPLGGAVVAGVDWNAGSWRSLGFLTAVGGSSALLSIELAFRRLLIGQPDRAGLMLVMVGAVSVAAWTLLAAPLLPGFSVPLWLCLAAAAAAGCLYLLSGSLVVSSLYTGAVLASLGAVEAVSTEWSFAAAHGGVAAILSAVVLHRRGLLAGLR